MTADAALTALHDAAALSSWDPEDGDFATAVVEVAVDCLVAGLDSPTLAILAGAGPGEVPHLLPDVLTELSVTGYPERSRPAAAAALRVMAGRVLRGVVHPQYFAEWVYVDVGSGISPIADELVLLHEDVMFPDESADPLVRARYEAAVVAVARRLAGPQS